MIPALRLSGTIAFGTPPIAESAFHMGADPVRQRLGLTRFRVGVVRRAERRDKNMRTMLGARDGIKYRDGIAGPIDDSFSPATCVTP